MGYIAVRGDTLALQDLALYRFSTPQRRNAAGLACLSRRLGYSCMGSPEQPELVVSRGDRDTVMIIRTAVPRIPITRAEADSVLKHHLNSMNQTMAIRL